VLRTVSPMSTLPPNENAVPRAAVTVIPAKNGSDESERGYLGSGA
jgi:hypothetical protein